MAATSTSASVLADVHYRQRFVLVVTTLLIVLSTTTVILRVWARGITHQRLRSDDLWMLLALPFSYIDGICQYLGKTIIMLDRLFSIDLLYRTECGLGET